MLPAVEEGSFWRILVGRFGFGRAVTTPSVSCGQPLCVLVCAKLENKTVLLANDRSDTVKQRSFVLALAALLSVSFFGHSRADAVQLTEAGLCTPIASGHSPTGGPGPAPVAAPYTGSAPDWALVMQAIAKSDWATARADFEKGSTYRGAAFTGAGEPADTFYHRGIYGYVFQSMYQAAFCGDTSTLTYADASAAPLYKAALLDAIYRRYASAKNKFAALLAAHPSFGPGRNAAAVLAAITKDRSTAISDWQYVAAHDHPTALGQPSVQSIDAVEYLLYSDSRIMVASQSVSSTAVGGKLGTIAHASPPPAFARFTSPAPGSTPLSPPFDILENWTDAPAQKSFEQVVYVHVRVYVHPSVETKVRSKNFRLEGDVDGRPQTYEGLSGSAPYVQKNGLASTGRIQKTIVPSVSGMEDLGRMQTLDLQGGEGKTVVVTFKVPPNAQFTDSQLHAVRIVSGP
jgi:hypothetical protein